MNHVSHALKCGSDADEQLTDESGVQWYGYYFEHGGEKN
jgi:hypothetical protein